MATKSFVRTRAGQRVDQPDFERASDTSTRDVVEQIGEHFLTGSDTSRHYILEGFGTTAVGTTLTVQGGKALLGYRDRGEIRYGSMATSGATSRSIDIGAFTNGNYTVYVCLSLGDTEFGNRAFWDAAIVTPAEVTRNVATRRAENWAIAVETTSPGAEWIPIYTLTKGSGTITALTDVREFFFEGQAANSFATTDHEWGTIATDRNSNRATYGIRSLRKFVRAVQRQLNAIIGDVGWWSTPPIGGDLVSLLANKLNRSGTQPMTGNLLPDADNTRDLGASATRWNEIFGTTGVFNQITARGTNPVGANPEGRHLIAEATASGSSPNAEYRNIYQSQNSALYVNVPAIEVAINAQWYEDSPGNWRWRPQTTAQQSYLYGFSRAGVFIFQRNSGSTSWTEGSWTTIVTIDATTADFATLTNTNVANLLADRATLSVNAPTTPVANTAYANTLVVARGTIATNGAGGLTVAAGSFNGGVNVTAAFTAGDIRVTFNTPVGGASNYQVICTPWTVGVGIDLQAKTATDFDVSAFTSSTGLDLPMDTNAVTFDFVVVGG